MADVEETPINEDECEDHSAVSDIHDLDEELGRLPTDEKDLVALGLEDFLAPGGSWEGSELPVRRAIAIGQRNGLVVTSLKRRSGNSGSDHHTSQARSFAADQSNSTGPTPAMLRTARQIAAALGYSWPANGYLTTRTSSRGYRGQLIYNSSVVPGHSNHVHFGVRKVQ